MARPLRIEFAGALYHVTARGDRKERVYLDDADCARWLDTLADVCARYCFVVHAYCLMRNHYHLLVETPDGQLAKGMRQLNGVYSQAFNRRHDLVGHVFQGRYNAIVCQKESYLMELARYIVLNPVRAKMVAAVDDWPWSSHAFVMGEKTAPPWFDAAYLLSCFGGDLVSARQAYLAFTLAGVDAKRPLDEVKHQLYLGDVPVEDNKTRRERVRNSADYSRAHKRAMVGTLASYFVRANDIETGIVNAYASRAFSMADIARHCGCSRQTISRILRAEELKLADASVSLPTL